MTTKTPTADVDDDDDRAMTRPPAGAPLPLPVDDPAAVATALATSTSTFAADAGVALLDRPAPLLRLLVLATLLASPIHHEVALRASRSLRPFTGSARALAAAEVDDVSRALTLAGYWRFHRTKAALLVRTGAVLHGDYGGDLRTLYRDATGPADLHRRLTRVPGVGEQAAHIVLREAQGVWPDVQPYLDDRVLHGAAALGLPTEVDALAATVTPDLLPRLAAGCVRATLRPRRRPPTMP